MTTGVLNAEVRARRVDIARLLLTLFVAPFYAAGWLAARAVHLAALSVTAVRLGWQEGRATTTPDRSDTPTARSPASPGDPW